jgi:hypothetical protein
MEKMKIEKKTAGGLAKGRRFLGWVVVLVVTGVVLTGCDDFVKSVLNPDPDPYQPNVNCFSNGADEGGSAIDTIKAATEAGKESVTIKMPSGSEEVALGMGTDFGDEGLALTLDTSPAFVTITGSGSVIDLIGSEAGHLISVGNGVTLTLMNVTLKGLNTDNTANKKDKTDNNYALIKVNQGGKLVLGYGAVITDNNNSSEADEIVHNGGGVCVYDGELVMFAGSSIKDNISKRLGGGVYMYGLTARYDRSQPPPHLRGVFTMNGGTISGNKTNRGGGVFLAHGSELNMNAGAEIKENEAGDAGGGVEVTSGESNFSMRGGTISGNTAKGAGGGGVCLSDNYSILNLDGGTISGNTAEGAAEGGGVLVRNWAMFAMRSGSSITNNTAKNGGGISMNGIGTEVSIFGGTISNNTALVSGGGAYLFDNWEGFFKMWDGTISYNTANGQGATDGGGGVYANQGNSNGYPLTRPSTIIRGGIIERNNARNGGGVYMVSGIFYKEVPVEKGARKPGGIIYGEDAPLDGTGNSPKNKATGNIQSHAIRLGSTNGTDHVRHGTHDEYLELLWGSQTFNNDGINYTTADAVITNDYTP